ncbi:MAG TPA: germination protein YpeB [Clostridiaceae bacterium]|nr:germination protein YpeB [Clostridiaceae bacterium]
MGFREKLLDFKRRLSDRKMYSIVIVVIGAVAIWGLSQYRQAISLQQKLDNMYNRAFYDMLGYVNNVETLLVKSLITSTQERTAATLQEAWRQANLAQENLGQIPVPQHILANTSKFLSQVGDFSYALNNQTMYGKQLSDEQYKTIEQLHGFALSLQESLADLQNKLATERIKWGDLAAKGKGVFNKASSEMPEEQFTDIDKTFQEYPTLIYDGPFSDHLTTIEPMGLTGDMLNSEQAKQSVVDFFGADKIRQINFRGPNENGAIKTFSYQVLFKDRPDEEDAVIDITQKGGHVYWALRHRPVPQEILKMEEAKEAGKRFLEEHGFGSMVDTYYIKEDNMATINYAYKQGDVTVYPDLVKVKVALDDGEVLGIECKGYLYSHREREIPEVKFSPEEARKLITPRMEVLSTGLAIIPTDYKTEIFCHEFKGKLNDREFLVYINAENGHEEKILIILDTPNGILTM